MSEFEEETYSAIFAALKHPVRRRILRLLSDGPRSFTEMQNLFKVDSPYLTYHLDSLKDLVSKTEEGNYRLSSTGESAVALMKGVEETPTPVALRYRLPLKWRSYIVVLALATIILGSVCTIQLFTFFQPPSGKVLGFWGPNYIEVYGRAELLYPISFTQHPFFHFTMRARYEYAVSPLVFEVVGSQHEADYFMNERISPTFSNLTVDWEAKPWVKVFGRLSGINDITNAYFVDVKIDGEWKNWYYKSFLTKDERWSTIIFYYAKRNIHARYEGKQEFVTWIEGTLTEDDLIGFLWSWEDGNLTGPFPIPPQHLGKQAYVNGVIIGAGGVALVVKEIYVKQGDTYVKVYEKE